MLMNGPMVGSGFPGSSRFAMAAKSPQTGIWGEAACGGNFGPELKRGINNLLRITVKDDVLPKKILTALGEGAAAGSVPDVKLLRDEYYSIRGLTPGGIVRPEKLLELGLPELKERLYR